MEQETIEQAKARVLEELRYRPSAERLDANLLLDNFHRGLQLLRPVAERIVRQLLEQTPLEPKPLETSTHPPR
jgi:hypothetical protein